MSNVILTPGSPNSMPVEPDPAPSAQPYALPASHPELPPLNTDDPALLARLERQLGSGKTPSSTVATAVATIKRKGLARLHQLTFHEYCSKRLRIKKSRVHQLLEFAELLEVTASSGPLSHAGNERQLRPLTKLPRADWSDTWAEAVRTAPSGKLSGRHVESIVHDRLAKIRAAQVPAPAPASNQPPVQATMPTTSSDMVDAIPPATSTKPAPQPYATGCIPTVPGPEIKMPGWKEEWVRIARDPARPPASLRSGVFGWQAPN